MTQHFWLSAPAYCTLYSKQETQRCSRSSKRLICSTDKSDTQRSRRAASAFFSTHRKHTSRVLLHSADRELDWRPAWWRQTHKLSGSLLICFSTKWLFTESSKKEKEQWATYRLRGGVVLQNRRSTRKCGYVELQKGQSDCLSKLRQQPPTQICDMSVCRAWGYSLTPVAITHHCGQCKWVGFGMRQRGAGNRHGNRLTDSVAAVWVSIVGVGRGMPDPSRRRVYKEIWKALSGVITLEIKTFCKLNKHA